MAPGVSPRNKRGQFRSRNEWTRNCTGREVREAERLARSFSGGRNPNGYFDLPITWPTKAGNWAKATRIGYRSNKFDGIWRDYTHKHDLSLPNIVVQWGPHMWKRGQVPIYLPRPQSFAILGFVLDLEYKNRRGEPDHWDWKEEPFLPFLCGDPATHDLVIVPQCGGYPMVLQGRDLTIEPEGITH